MSKYRLLSLIWLIPLWLGVLTIQQLMVYFGAENTFENGQVLSAQVEQLEIKQIAAQSNGYIVIRFITNEGKEIRQKKTLSIQMAQELLELSVVPIYYLEGGYPEVVMLPTYEIQRKTSLFNASVALIGFLAMVAASVKVQRYSNQRSLEKDDTVMVERVDV